MTFRRAEFDRDVLALDETRLAQAGAERGHEIRDRGKRRAPQESDDRQRRPLRVPRAAMPPRRRGA